MASPDKRLASNVPGSFYVDTSCIDCDTCRRIVPAVFDRAEEKSRVHAQPSTREERFRSTQALLACPTGSIGVETRDHLVDMAEAFPEVVEDNVLFCGYTSRKSFGASSYLIVRPGGNVLVDSPRSAAPLVRRIEALGGVAQMFMTHKDDVADHAGFARRFGCRRILHADDVSPDTRAVEFQPGGTDPIRLDDELVMIPVPGHTRGHAVLLYRDRFLFTGDHLAFSPALGHLYAFKRFCWYSFEEQVNSMRRLLDYDFEWVLPGHGHRFHAPRGRMKEELSRCIDWMLTA